MRTIRKPSGKPSGTKLESLRGELGWENYQQKERYKLESKLTRESHQSIFMTFTTTSKKNEYRRNNYTS